MTPHSVSLFNRNVPNREKEPGRGQWLIFPPTRQVFIARTTEALKGPQQQLVKPRNCVIGQLSLLVLSDYSVGSANVPTQGPTGLVVPHFPSARWLINYQLRDTTEQPLG